jgi:hypothetical protein
MTAPPNHRVPHVRDSFIVANVGKRTFIEAAAAKLDRDKISKVEVDSE